MIRRPTAITQRAKRRGDGDVGTVVSTEVASKGCDQFTETL